MKSYMLGSILLAAAALTSPSFAAVTTIAGIYANDVAGTDTINSATVVDVIDSYPATTPTKNSYILSDGTGSILAYSELISAYPAHVGDVINITTNNAPYGSFPELKGTGYTVTVVTPGSGSYTAPVIPLSAFSSNPEAYVTISDVTLPSGTTSLSNSTSYTLTDSSGTGTLYTYASYSQVSAAIAAANANPSILSGPLDITGYVDPYTSGGVTTYELYPTSIVASASAPEPASLGLLSIGALAMLARRRRNA